MGWSRLIEYVLESDDRVERYFLEVKSEADLNSKRDQAKVAKYILGAANRDLAQAQRRFGGHALMVLGVGNGTVVGVRPFEAKDLGRAIQRLIGADGPGWDFERIRVDGHDVIIIVVDPPTGDMWTCRADTHELTDGGIYVRADGETRQATGDEVRALITRAASRPPTVDVDVAIEGEVLAIQVDESVLTAWIQTTAEQLRAQAASTKSRSPFASMSLMRDTRPRDEFLDEVDSWQEKAMESPTEGIVSIAGRMGGGIRVHLRNHARTFLRDVRLDIATEDEIVATDWLPGDTGEYIDPFPDRPADWGERTVGEMLGPGFWRTTGAATAPQSRHGIVHIHRVKPAYLTR